MRTRKIGQFEVSAIGLGCMSLSHAYGSPPPRDRAEQVLLGALDAGYTFFDTAAVYGLGHNETLVGEVLGPHRAKFTLASKCGITDATGTQRGLDGRPETIKALCDVSLRRLNTDVIDLYYLHRWDQRVPIEESVGALADLVAAGKIRSIGLSEVSAPTLRRAHATHPIAALQTEYSPWSRNAEIAVLDACRELGVAFVAFSPVGRGFLAGESHDPAKLEDGDFRKNMPRWQAENLEANLALYARFKAIADDAGCTTAQLCLAWLLAKDPIIVPIPGTTNPGHMREDAAAAGLTLSPELIARVDATVNGETVSGSRYPPALQASVETERMAGE
ncbi:MAG: aldo/keto reductase [Phenylobacterium sp.]|uniref:aldo/keto reductase n=1 Tax=Phenylobacterium sp. TaxID=1871053 RepID=UPI001A518418|nr:aldo/keto reductase [Phenylobacterium sp.]MBL8555210.1 aldo/keto reductase [Phenylobacterium sp.]